MIEIELLSLSVIQYKIFVLNDKARLVSKAVPLSNSFVVCTLVNVIY